METERILIILKSLALNFPVLKEWGFLIPRLICVIVNSGSFPGVIRELRNFPESRSHNSDFIFLTKGNSAKAKAFIDEAKERIRLGEIGSGGLPILIQEGGICNIKEDLFYVFVDEDVLDFNPGIDQIVPNSGDLSKIKDKTDRFCRDKGLSAEENVLRAAVCFLHRYICDVESSLEDWFHTVHKVCELSSGYSDNIDSIFKDTLFLWAADNDFKDAYDLSEFVLSDDKTQLERCVFFDRAYMFLHNALFKEIAKPLLDEIPINMLKKELRDAGIIIPNAITETFLSKMSYRRADGSRARIDMLRFPKDLSKDEEGGNTFIDRVLIRRNKL